MDETSGAYFDWLYSQVAPANNWNPVRSRRQLLEVLIGIDFTWTVPNDDNRVMDALELRGEVVRPYPDPDDSVNFLEMLIALSRRAAFMSEKDSDIWFWHILSNLGIEHLTDEDPFSRIEVSHITEIVHNVIERKYGPDGQGGLFPLDRARIDQTRVELWYQLSAYLLEGKGP